MVETTARSFSIQTGLWNELGHMAAPVRIAVFVNEQRVPLSMEWDAADATATHAVALAADGTAVGTGRLLQDGHIGRMAVLAPYRRTGIGGALLRALLRIAVEKRMDEVALNAQVHAVPFYERFGFTVSSPVFDEAGIPHQAMRLGLSPDSGRN